MKIRSIDEAQIAARLIKQELEAAGLLGETQAQLAESLDAYIGSLAKELAEILAISSYMSSVLRDVPHQTPEEEVQRASAGWRC